MAATASHSNTFRRLTTRFIFGILEDRDLPVVQPHRWTRVLRNRFAGSTHFPARLASSLACMLEDLQLDTAQERFGVPRVALQP
jgi:hypothetical protein